MDKPVYEKPIATSFNQIAPECVDCTNGSSHISGDCKYGMNAGQNCWQGHVPHVKW